MNKKKFTLTFQNAWVLSKREEERLPVERFLAVLKENMDIRVLAASLADCEVVVEDDVYTDEGIKKIISAVLEECFAIGLNSDVVSFSMEDYQAPAGEENEPEERDEEEEEKEEEESFSITLPDLSPPKKKTADEVMEGIHRLIGVQEFKALADECALLAPGIVKHKTFDVFTHWSYLFSINDGNGLTTYLERFADLVEALGLFELGQKNRIVELKLPHSSVKERGGDPFLPVKELFKSYAPLSGHILCLDISEWMTKAKSVEFRSFLSFLEDHSGKNLVVFRVPFVEKKILEELKQAIGDVLMVREVSFAPFDNGELIQVARQKLSEMGFSAQEDVWDIFKTRMAGERKDGRFYGINTINKVVREMVYYKQLANAVAGKDDTVILKDEAIKLQEGYDATNIGMETLDDMVGMASLKQRIEEIVAQIMMLSRNKSLGQPCIHMRFVGNPGTGKTTVARVIGTILREKGILRNGGFFEYSGRDFCGRYVGETAPKTAAICRDAYGSVLFIDEAYTLYKDENRGSVDYGQEAIDTMIAEMENHRSDLVVIMAGYPKEMETLMKSNPGLESRMPFVIEFPNYTREQLYEIYMQMVERSFQWEEGFREAVKEYFDNISDEVLSSQEFSNARFVRNLFERTWNKASMRCQLKKEDFSTLVKEDFLLASGEQEFVKLLKKTGQRIGFA